MRLELGARGLAVAERYLLRQEVVNGLMLSSLRSSRDSLLALVLQGDEVRVVGLSNHSKLHLSQSDDPDAVAFLARELARHAPGLAGVQGPTAVAAWFSDAWAATTGHPPRRRMAMRIFRLDEVERLQWAPGTLCRATEQVAGQLAGWVVAFAAESDPGTSMTAAAARELVERHIEVGTLMVWRARDEVVSMASRRIGKEGAARINLVYTPPDRRGKGYASACVAALSQASLEEGCRYCYLYTDLANPISNSIYPKIGYRAVADCDEYWFSTPD